MSGFIAIALGAILGCTFGKAVYFPARPVRITFDDRPRLGV